jgi:hypothetical protein
MTAARDAFGRAAGTDPEASAARSAPIADLGPPPAGPRRVPGSGAVPLLMVMLVCAGAVWATLRAAVDTAEGDAPSAMFAVARDPLDPQSLLHARPLRAAIERAGRELRPGEAFTGLTVAPERVTLTAVDGREQQRWIGATAGGDVHTTALSSTSDARPVDLQALDLRVPERAVVARLRALAPYAREPRFSLVADAETGRPTGWTLSFSNVRQADASYPVDLRGRPQ